MRNTYTLFKSRLFVVGLLILLCNSGISAQTVSTYFNFAPDTQYPNSLAADSNGNLYYIKYDVNWQRQIAKLSPQGVATIILPGNYNPQSLISDAGGNVYFVDTYNWPSTIKKITSDGIISDVINSQDNYPQNLAADNQGNIYFTDAMNWPTEIKKVTADGSVSVIVSGNYNPGSMVCDPAGNLYFTDDYNWPATINQVTPAGEISTFVSGNNNPLSLTVDNDGNLYFLDNYNWPPGINKVTPDGNVTIFVNSGIENPNSLTTDKYGSVYFINQFNGQYKISIVKNSNAPCNAPAAPVSMDAVTCSGSSISLWASGMGEIKWYDEAVAGNLIGTGSNFIPPLVYSNTSYFAEANICDSISSRTPVLITVIPSPVPVITGNTTGNDYVSLAASGGITYMWSGGLSTSLPTNTFIKNGSYSVTVTNAGGCAAVAFASVVINKFGLTKFGQLSTDTSIQMDRFGGMNADTYINKHGKNTVTKAGDGLLNYQVFRNSGGYANNASEFPNFMLAANQTSAGVSDASALLDWTSWNVLVNAGIPVPNNGEQFSVLVDGYFIPQESGNYTFSCEGDDAVDLFINNVYVASNYGAHGTAGLGSHTGVINVVQGTRYSFRARMQENGGGEGLRVFWRKPSDNSGWNIYSSELSSF